MRKLENSPFNGTSWYGYTVGALPSHLIKVFGEPTYMENGGEDKVNMEWHMISEHGIVFTIYDWKTYRPLEMDELVDWHIGAHSEIASKMVQAELDRFLTSDEPVYDSAGFTIADR